ncbi:YqgE/AlgH family protein [Myxococcus stipitatus]|uniref:YqgE/AlgH family protein n=1 Tax=Myxococcus stipitatus TaxID=83455 RepID=UPI001F302C7D|nr:YqgE/AlgH family protein [Myxococcus stipitatus]MCE9672006.1 YqgE/AlgH family protein [Myxococcus stipitatus]
MSGPDGRSFARRHPVAPWLVLGVSVLVLFPRLITSLKDHEHVPADLRPGVLLIARPGRVSGAFDETVVLLLETGRERTWGVVLNRVRPTPDASPPPDVDRWGGPVQPENHVTITLEEPPPEGAIPLLAGLSWHLGRREARTPLGRALTFEGLSVWGPGQLESEVARGAWWVTPAKAADVFTAPGSLWVERALQYL